jgi:hypothetical protein
MSQIVSETLEPPSPNHYIYIHSGDIWIIMSVCRGGRDPVPALRAGACERTSILFIVKTFWRSS